MSRAFGLIGMVVGVIVIGAIATVLFLDWSNANRYEAYSECQVRRMESHISDEVANIHTGYCMASSGYVRSGCSSDLVLLPGCFIPRWQNW